jgi:hypothetical protein
LNLVRTMGEEWTADGRSDGGYAGYPALAGIHPVFANSAQRGSNAKGRSKRTIPSASRKPTTETPLEKEDS